LKAYLRLLLFLIWHVAFRLRHFLALLGECLSSGPPFASQNPGAVVRP
jgi:hypothetical protein